VAAVATLSPRGVNSPPPAAEGWPPSATSAIGQVAGLSHYRRVRSRAVATLET